MSVDKVLRQLYRDSLSLATDLYELTMAYAYWKTGTASKEAVFNMIFRHHPFQGGFTVACGLGSLIDFLSGFHFAEDDLRYLAQLKGSDGRPLFEEKFLEYLRGLRLACDVDAVPEGTVVFPQEPLVRVRGPILQAQILETAILTFMNYQTLIATKAARVCQAARGDPVIEFGLRRAPGIDGGVSASWAAYVGGCESSSNVLAGKLCGIPVRGTHAHSWIMSFDSELESFQRYAEAMPNNCVFLVDTYDTLEGVRHAAQVGQWLRERGHKLLGIRLDSGDLAYLSIEARKILDAAGFTDARILASSDLDEYIIQSLKEQGATIAVWGVGTRLVTAQGQSSLGGVYKLTAVRQPGGPWQYKLKLSEQAVKISTPGIQQVRRFHSGGEFIGDMIYDTELGIRPGQGIIDPADPTRRKKIPPDTPSTELLAPIFRGGWLVYQSPPAPQIQAYARRQLAGFHAGVKRFINPHRYPAGLEEGLHELRTRLILEARGT